MRMICLLMMVLTVGCASTSDRCENDDKSDRCENLRRGVQSKPANVPTMIRGNAPQSETGSRPPIHPQHPRSKPPGVP